MTNVQSKLIPIPTTCIEYVHPWTESCWNSTAGLIIQCSLRSLRIYTTVYMLSTLMRSFITYGRIPNKHDIKRTILGIIQSSAFLTTNGFAYIMFTCFLRKIFDCFHFMTIAYTPAFLASFVAILIERPTRRTLLSLYVANVATETLWRMGVSRGIVRSVPNGQALIFGTSSAILLYFYRLGLHKIYKDSLFAICRFVVGRAEEGPIRKEQQNVMLHGDIRPAPQAPSPPGGRGDSGPSRSTNRNRNHFRNISYIVQIYAKLVKKLKSQIRHRSCPHSNSCIYYSISNGLKLFTTGYGLQVTLKLILQIKRIIQFRLKWKKTLFSSDTFKLGLFLGGFSLIYKSATCALRHIIGEDHAIYAIPASLLASCAFTQYPDTTIALYVMWKMLQITYNIGIEKGIVPKVPGFTIFLYCASTATLFHAATFEPLNLRPSYWTFLQRLSGGRVGVMDRRPLDIWGLDSYQAAQEVMKLTNTANEPMRFAFR